VDVQLENLKRKHEEEKQRALQDLQNFKSNCALRETKISKDYQIKVESLRSEIEAMNNKFKEKLTQYEVVNKDLKASIEGLKKQNVNEVAELKAKHNAEISDLVTTNNEKFRAMLVDQLKLQEQLRAENITSVERARQEVKDQMAAETETLLGRLRAQLGETTLGSVVWAVALLSVLLLEYTPSPFLFKSLYQTILLS